MVLLELEDQYIIETIFNIHNSAMVLSDYILNYVGIFTLYLINIIYIVHTYYIHIAFIVIQYLIGRQSSLLSKHC